MTLSISCKLIKWNMTQTHCSISAALLWAVKPVCAVLKMLVENLLSDFYVAIFFCEKCRIFAIYNALLCFFFFAGLQFMVCHEVKWKRCSRIKMIKWHALNVMLVIAHEDGAWYGYRSKFNWYHLSLFYLFFLTFFFFPVPLI